MRIKIVKKGGNSFSKEFWNYVLTNPFKPSDIKDEDLSPQGKRLRKERKKIQEVLKRL